MTEKNGVERSTATDVLRRLLDERGVEYDTAATVISGIVATFWHDRDGYPCAAISGTDDIPDGEVSVQAPVTPAQAIAATLGSCNCSNNCTNGERTETCQADETETWECVRDDLGGYGKTLTVHVMECTKCGHTYEHVNGDYEYCPRCGRKRKDVDE